MEMISWLIAGHFIGDFPFQPAWIAEWKGKSWEVNAYHALTYTATVLVAAKIGGFSLPLWAMGIILISHFIIDPLKARWRVIKPIWLDQILHLVVLFAVAFFIK